MAWKRSSVRSRPGPPNSPWELNGASFWILLEACRQNNLTKHEVLFQPLHSLSGVHAVPAIDQLFDRGMDTLLS